MPWFRAAALEGYFEVATAAGLEPARMLWTAGINPSHLSDPDQRIPGRAVAHLLELSARQSGCPHFALLLAERRTITTLGPFSLLAQHVETLGDVINGIVRYQNVIADALSTYVEILDSSVIFHIGLMIESRSDDRQCIDLVMAAMMRIFTHVCGSGWHPESVHFVHEVPLYPKVYERMFGCPLEFNSVFNGFVCTKQSLSDPNADAHPDMAQHARNYLETLRKLPQDIPIDERIRRSLQLGLPMGRTTLEQIADDLHIHPRSLQRLLEKEGLTYATILADARRELTMRYLQSETQPLSAIPALVGYGSASTFSRWFRTQFGLSPTAWRAQQFHGR